MRMFRNVALASAAMCFAAASHAGFIAIDNVAPGATTVGVAATNEFAETLASLGITSYSTGLSLGTDTAGTVTFYYYGKEAGFRNDFLAPGLSLSTSYAPYEEYFGSPIEIGSLSVGPGLLDFGFCAYESDVDPVVGCVSNAQNDWLAMSSFQSIAMSVSEYSAWLFWDDAGAGPDDNHDDMIVQAVFRPTAVPEPATGALIGLGLLAMGLARRRKQPQS